MFGRNAIVLTNTDGSVGDAESRNPKFGQAGNVAGSITLWKLGHLSCRANQLLKFLGLCHRGEQKLCSNFGRL